MWEAVRDLDGLPPHLTFEIAHFFEVYKDLEPNKHTEPGTWEGREVAEARYEAAVRRHRER